MSEPTIEVHGMFGKPKHVTRLQYINEWANHCDQLYNLTVTQDDHATIVNMVATLKEMAGRRWDEIYERENRHV